MTNSEEKLSEAPVLPDAADLSNDWDSGIAEADEYAGKSAGEEAQRIGRSAGQEGGSPGAGLNDAQDLRSKAAVPAAVNESLARLEMNSLEVKLYLDSIDQRISRMEPRLEEMRSSEPVAALPAEGTPQPRPVVAEGEPLLSTTERRRRVQGVPVERRRSPHALQEEEEGESWFPKAWPPKSGPPKSGVPTSSSPKSWFPKFWFSKSWAARSWSRKSWATKSWATDLWGSQAWMQWVVNHRIWVPIAALGLIAFPLLFWWGSGQHGRTKSHAGAVDAGPVLAGAMPNGARKDPAGVPWATETASAESHRARPEAATHKAEPQAVPPAPIEQGVVVPSGSLPAASVAAQPPVAIPPVQSAAVADSPAPQTSPSSLNAPEGTPPDPVSSRTGSATSARIIPPPSRRVNVSSGVMAGNLIYSRQPPYPHGLAGLFHTQGEVVLQAIISKRGRVENLRVISGHFMLRGAAKDAVRTWRYRPYLVNGSPVEVATIVSVEFRR